MVNTGVPDARTVCSTVGLSALGELTSSPALKRIIALAWFGSGEAVVSIVAPVWRPAPMPLVPPITIASICEITFFLLMLSVRTVKGVTTVLGNRTTPMRSPSLIFFTSSLPLA
jgi:hypothetical protein